MPAGDMVARLIVEEDRLGTLVVVARPQRRPPPAKRTAKSAGAEVEPVPEVDAAPEVEPVPEDVLPAEIRQVTAPDLAAKEQA